MTTPADIGTELAGLIADELLPLDEVAKRIVINRIQAVLALHCVVARAAVQASSALTPFTDAEARRYGNTPMVFGKHTGTLVCYVPTEYLEWLADSSRELWNNLHRYLGNMRVRCERHDLTDDDLDPHTSIDGWGEEELT